MTTRDCGRLPGIASRVMTMQHNGEWHSAGREIVLFVDGGSFKAKYTPDGGETWITCKQRGGKRDQRFTDVAKAAQRAAISRYNWLHAKERRAAQRAQDSKRNGIESVRRGLQIDVSNLAFNEINGVDLDFTNESDRARFRDNCINAVESAFGDALSEDAAVAFGILLAERHMAALPFIAKYQSLGDVAA